MWLPSRHRRAPVKDWAATPFWSLTLPSWASAQPGRAHRIGEPELATRTFAACGTVENGTPAVIGRVDADDTQGARPHSFRSRVGGDWAHYAPRR